jgi:hypothetical protein
MTGDNSARDLKAIGGVAVNAGALWAASLQKPDLQSSLLGNLLKKRSKRDQTTPLNFTAALTNSESREEVTSQHLKCLDKTVKRPTNLSHANLGHMPEIAACVTTPEIRQGKEDI